MSGRSFPCRPDSLGIANPTTPAFEGRTGAFSRDATFLRCTRRARCNAFLWLLRRGPHQVRQPPQCVTPVCLLRPETPGIDYQNVLQTNPAPAQAAQACLDILGKRGAGTDVEAQLHCRGNFVHVLPARSGCTDMAEFQFCFGYWEMKQYSAPCFFSFGAATRHTNTLCQRLMAQHIMRRCSRLRRPTGKVLRAVGNFPGVLAIENDEGYICGGSPKTKLERAINKQAASRDQSVLEILRPIR